MTKTQWYLALRAVQDSLNTIRSEAETAPTSDEVSTIIDEADDAGELLHKVLQGMERELGLDDNE